MRSIPLLNSPRVPTTDGTSEIDILQFFMTLRRGKWTIALFVMLFMVLGGYYVFRVATPLYSATTVVALQSRANQTLGDIDTVVSNLSVDLYTINTELEVLRARDLIGRVVDELKLIEDPNFNYTLKQSSGFSLGWLFGESEDAEPVPDEVIREEIITMVRRSLQVTNIEFSRVYQVTILTPDPERSAAIVNTLADFYIKDQIAIKQGGTEQANEWLVERVADLREEVTRAENALEAFKASMELIDPAALEALNRQVKDFRTRSESLRGTIGRLEQRIAQLDAAVAADDTEAIVELANDQLLDQILPRLPDARDLFDQRAAAIMERARADLRTRRSQLMAVEQSIAEIDTKIVAQQADLLKLKSLARDAEASRKIYESFEKRQKETSVQQGLHAADSRVLSRAIIPIRAASPRKVFTLFISAVLGFFVGCAWVVVREARQTGFLSPQDLEQFTGMNVLAQIPRAPFTKRRRLLSYLATKNDSALSEAVRNLRTSVLLSNIDQPPQIIMVTSSLPGEGKTTQSLALAQSFAGMGKRVLLIEGDIRRRTFQEYLDARERPGLVTAISGERPLEEIVYPSKELGADVLVGEKSAINAADFFSSARIKTFLDEIRALYDVVIIDTPPVLVVPDARVIGQMADAVIYAVHWNKTTRAQVMEGLQEFATVDVKVSGLVLSQVDFRKAQYYGGKYAELYKSYGSKYYSS